jgi:NADH-quinone oxidoreductase subunit J
MARNPVHSVLWLILAFFNAAGLMVLAGAEFIAMLLVIVYVGAVAVLFLFVVMMLDIDFAELRAGVMRYAAIGLALAVALVAEIIIAIGAYSAGGIQLGRRIAPIDAGVPNIEAIGQLLYTRYLFVFEGAGLVLLVAMIGAIVLTYRQRSDVRPQNINRQINRRSKDATRNMNPPVGQGVEL